MKKRTKRLIGALFLVAGTVGTGGALLMKRSRTRRPVTTSKVGDVWARPGMMVTFRAEVMPGRESSERTFRVEELLPSGRVRLQGFAGEHNEKEFEPVRLNQN